MTTTTATAERLANLFSIHPDTQKVVFTNAEGDDRDTLLAMTFAANQAGISYDYSYSMVRDVLQQIADTEPRDLEDLDMDGLIDFDNYSLMEFISDGTNWTFADEFKEEAGEWPATFTEIVQAAQDRAYCAALAAVVNNWPEEEAAEDDDDDDE